MEANGTTAGSLKEQVGELRAEKRKLLLEAEVSQLKQAQRLRQLTEATVVPDWVAQYVDLLDRYRDGQTLLTPISTPNDRRYGRNFPLWQTEQELALLRAPARVLCATNPYARGLLRGLRSFVIGEGFSYRITPKDDRANKGFVHRVQEVIDGFIEGCYWQSLERELFWRSREDGEFFLRTGLGDDGRTWVRTVEPEQILQPPGSDQDHWSFGIQTDPDDVQEPLAYWVSNLRNIPEGEEVPANELVHYKANSKRSIKRGVTDFAFDVHDALATASRLRKCMGEGSAVQAAIAGIRQHSTSTQAQVGTYQQGLVDYSRTHPVSGRQLDYSEIPPGTMLDIPASYNYIPPPAAGNSEAHVVILDALLRAAASSWNAPEWLVSSNAQNMGAYTASLVAESPFVIGIKTEQDEYREKFVRVMKIVLRHAIQAGFLPRETLQWVTITCEPPNIEHRDKAQDAATDQTLILAGVKSRQMAAQERGYDWEQVERENEEFEERHGAGLGLPMPGEPGAREATKPIENLGALGGMRESVMEAIQRLQEEGFTGTITDKRGRKYKYVNGRRVAVWTGK